VLGILTAAELAHGRRVLDELYHCSDPELDAPGIILRGGRAVGRERVGARVAGRHFITNLVSKDAELAELMTREPVVGLVRELLGDCILSSMNSLEPLPGHGGQELHRDEGPAPADGPVIVNTLWAFDDMDAGNGATRLIPGTHLTDELGSEDDPRLLRVDVPAGGAVIMNAHTLHAASRNEDGRRRRVVHVFYTVRGRTPQSDWSRYVPTVVRERLTDEQLTMLGLERASVAG
jgi:ectoine hydroxylase-related dioxygenase (phytanoyl-CoA dioxygenase family)